MALDINTLVPASIKAKNVATEEYVDTDIANNNNLFAQKLGYLPDTVGGIAYGTAYETLLANAELGNTVIDGGRINTNLITVDTVLAENIGAANIVAGSISGTEVVGKNIIGGTIKGTSISGAVIKSSWIDLRSTGFITDWQYFNESNPIPSGYEDRFISDATTGELIKDENGYYRLSKVEYAVFPSTYKVYSARSYHNTGYPDILYDIISYDDYLIDSENRVARARPKLRWYGTSKNPANAYNPTYGAHTSMKDTDIFWLSGSCDNHRVQGKFFFGEHYVYVDFGRVHPGTVWRTLTIDGVSYSLYSTWDTGSRTFTWYGIEFKISWTGYNWPGDVRLEVIPKIDPIDGFKYIEFDQDITTSVTWGFTDMHMQVGHDCEFPVIAVNAPELREIR